MKSIKVAIYLVMLWILLEIIGKVVPTLYDLFCTNPKKFMAYMIFFVVIIIYYVAKEYKKKAKKKKEKETENKTKAEENKK